MYVGQGSLRRCLPTRLVRKANVLHRPFPQGRHGAQGHPEPCLTHVSFPPPVFLSFSSQGGKLPCRLGECGHQYEGEGAKGDGW